MSRKRLPTGGNVLHQKALYLYEDLRCEKESKAFTARRRWLHRFKKIFHLKTQKITRVSI